MSSRYKRILLKLSGEALAGGSEDSFDPSVVKAMANEIKEVVSLGVEVGMVIGAGNIFRGSLGEGLGIDRATGDYMGMLGTVMNSLALKDALEKIDLPARVMTSFEMDKIGELFTIRAADNHLKKGRVVIAAGGTGHPFFTTDTAASLRALEIGADILLKATRVDGLYTADPEKDSNAKKIESATYMDVIKNNLRVMDLTGISLCMENSMPIVIFNLFEKGSLKKIISGEKIGTIIS